MNEVKKGIIFDIQRWSIHDGPGIRTNVFFKGCPLGCKWCSNPESQAVYPEVAFFPDKCIGCRKCVESCLNAGVSIGQGGHKIDYDVCKEKCYYSGFGYQCTSQCYAKAMKLIGEEYTVKKVLDEVLRDKPIYKQSGGGITVTGGEPLMQPEFLIELLKKSKKEKLHTTMETSAYSSFEVIEKTLPLLDFIFVDIKHMDASKHEKYTGVDNQLILDNLKGINEYAEKHDLEFVIRTPVVPGVNDTKKDISKIIDFIKDKLPTVSIYQLLPYHRLGRGKYLDIGMNYELGELEPMSEEDIQLLRDLIKKNNLKGSYE